MTDQRTGPEDFEGFFRAEHTRLLRALSLVAPADAEEIMQEAFLKVWERWDRVSRMESPVGYLYRVALNAARSGHRRRRARKANEAATVLQGAHDPGLGAVDDRDQVLRALATLTPRQREAIVVTELCDFTPTEAAGVLGVKPSTVRALTTQARASLKEVFGDA